MRSLHSSGRVALLAVAACLAGSALSVQAQETPLAGTWKLIVLPGGQEMTIWLVKIEQKDDKPNATIAASAVPTLKDVQVENVRVEGGVLRMHLSMMGQSLHLAAYASKDEKEPKTLLGSVSTGKDRSLVRLERTEQEKIDPAKASVTTAAGKAFFKMFSAKSPEDREKVLRDVIKEYPEDAVTYRAVGQLLTLLAKQDVKEADLRALAEQAVKSVAAHGPEMKQEVIAEMARELLKSKSGAAVALDYARQAEKMLGKDDPPETRQPVLKTLAGALRKTGHDDEARKLTEEITRLDAILDEEFRKTAVPFKTEPFAGRKIKSDRAVVVELFTGAQCPPCVAADVAFDALLKTYKDEDVVLLQYHLHIPRPDPLTNKASEDRAEFYEVNSTPVVFVNGKQAQGVGGSRQQGEKSYNALRTLLDKTLELEPQGQLKLSASRKGDKIDITAEVADLKKTGKDVRLRFVLLEDVVRYAGSNGQRLHHHVVRALPGGAAGVALEDKSGKYTESVDLAALRKSLSEYLTESNEKRPYLDDERPMVLDALTVVALIQDNDSKEVLAADQVDLPQSRGGLGGSD